MENELSRSDLIAVERMSRLDAIVNQDSSNAFMDALMDSSDNVFNVWRE